MSLCRRFLFHEPIPPMEMAEGKGRGYKYRMVGLNRGDFGQVVWFSTGLLGPEL